MFKYYAFIFAACFSLTACQQVIDEDQKVSVDTQEKIIKPRCRPEKMIRIHNTEKIKNMLIENGTITQDQTDVEKNKIVNAYIKKKQDAFKKCKNQGTL